MASRQVLKLCAKIEKDCGVVCKPETFCIERQNQSFFKWSMEVDVDKSTGFSKRALKTLGFTTCASQDYMKDLLRYKSLCKKVYLDCSEVEIIPKEF